MHSKWIRDYKSNKKRSGSRSPSCDRRAGRSRSCGCIETTDRYATAVAGTRVRGYRLHTVRRRPPSPRRRRRGDGVLYGATIATSTTIVHVPSGLGLQTELILSPLAMLLLLLLLLLLLKYQLYDATTIWATLSSASSLGLESLSAQNAVSKGGDRNVTLAATRAHERRPSSIGRPASS